MNITTPMSAADFVALFPGARKSGGSWIVKCPGHDDKNPSLWITQGKTGAPIWRCRAGCEQEAVLRALGLAWGDVFGDTSEDARPLASRPVQRPRPAPKPAAPESPPRCTLDDVRHVWAAARARAQDEARIDDDAAVYSFLVRRGLAESSTVAGAFGVIAPGMGLPSVFERWAKSGHRLVVPLFDGTGALANLQARRVLDVGGESPKTLNPPDVAVVGTVFADERGVQVLRGEWTGPRCLLWCEGLTDTLAATFTSPIPVVSSPGVGAAEKGVGPWAKDFLVYVALDVDAAGSKAAMRLGHTITDHGGRAARLVWPRGCKDLCDALTKLGTSGLRAFLVRAAGMGAQP